MYICYTSTCRCSSVKKNCALEPFNLIYFRNHICVTDLHILILIYSILSIYALYTFLYVYACDGWVAYALLENILGGYDVLITRPTLRSNIIRSIISYSYYIYIISRSVIDFDENFYTIDIVFFLYSNSFLMPYFFTTFMHI